MKNMDAAIIFKHVHYKISNTEILNNISGVFPKNQITTLLGPSGSGKTTLLKLCNNLISPSSGEITIYDKNTDNYPPEHLRKMVGMALQQAPMIHGTVYNNLQLPRLLHNQILEKDEAVTFLSRVGLDSDHLDKDIRDLSGGQKQRISLARTLINEPEILLLDEITASLDQESTHGIEELLLNIHREHHVTMIWITHDLAQAKRVADYMWLLKRGKLVETGNIDLLTSSSNKQLRQFVQGGNQ